MEHQENQHSENEQGVDQPLWVALAFSMIEKKKHAIYLIAANLLFLIYCIPWVKFFPSNALVEKLLLIEGWDWLLMLVPIMIWYLLCYNWMEKNNAWK